MSHAQRSLVAFRVVLGAALLYGSVRTVIEAAGATGVAHAGAVHVMLIGGVEAVGALLMLLPRTRTVGVTLLVLTIGAAFLLHLLRREFRPDLLVYLAGAVLVGAHAREPHAAP